MFRSFTFAPVVILSAAALIWGLVTLRADYLLSAVSNPVEAEALRRLGQVERESMLSTARSAATALGSSAESYVYLSRLSRELGFIERDEAKRLELFCESLSAAGQSVAMEPYNSRLLVNWANLRQLLGATDCQMPFTAGGYSTALEVARRNDPVNPDLMYAAALINSWSGSRSEVKSLLRDVLTYKTSLDSVQERFVASQIKSPEDLLDVVPARFPQVTRWAAWVLRNRPGDYERLASGFARLEAQAIVANRADLDAGHVDFEIYLERLLSLLELVRDSEVRQKVDLELSLALGQKEDSAVGLYLKKRAELVSLQALRSTITSDTLPLKKNFVSWGRRQQVALDDHYRSVGFYLADRQTLKVLELVADRPSARLSAQAIKIFVSEDNLEWRQLAGVPEPLALRLAEKAVLSFSPPVGNFRYWKIHFDSQEKEKSFSGDIDSMIRIYGLSSRHTQ